MEKVKNLIKKILFIELSAKRNWRKIITDIIICIVLPLICLIVEYKFNLLFGKEGIPIFYDFGRMTSKLMMIYRLLGFCMFGILVYYIFFNKTRLIHLFILICSSWGVIISTFFIIYFIIFSNKIIILLPNLGFIVLGIVPFLTFIIYLQYTILTFRTLKILGSKNYFIYGFPSLATILIIILTVYLFNYIEKKIDNSLEIIQNSNKINEIEWAKKNLVETNYDSILKIKHLYKNTQENSVKNNLADVYLEITGKNIEQVD